MPIRPHLGEQKSTEAKGRPAWHRSQGQTGKARRNPEARPGEAGSRPADAPIHISANRNGYASCMAAAFFFCSSMKSLRFMSCAAHSGDERAARFGKERAGALHQGCAQGGERGTRCTGTREAAGAWHAPP